MLSDNISPFLETLPTGSHFSCIYSSSQDLRPILTSFIKQGFEKNEQCLYIHYDNFQNDLKKALLKEKVNLEEKLSSKALIFQTPKKVYLKNGSFEEETVISLLESSLESAKELGFDGIRIIGDASCLKDEDELNSFMKYESKINNILEELGISALCLYNPKLYSNQALVDVIRTHRFIYYKERVIESKYYEPSDDFVPISGTSRNNTESIIKQTLT